MSAVLETVDLSLLARKYVANGWALVPIPSGGKFPTAKGWNLKANCVTTVEGCRRIRANVGLAHAYSRTCVLDFDDMAKAGVWLAEHGVDIAELWGALDAVKISSGRANRGKLLYRLPAGVAPLLTHQDHGGGIELRCASSNGKTMQDVLPPSIHPDTGRPYVWEYDDMLASWDNPPELPANVLTVWQGLSAKLDDARSEQMAYGDGDEAAARALLEDLDPDMTYPQWFKVGAALHHEFGGDHLGLELWDEWSAKGGKYPGWDYLEHKWGTIVRTDGPLATLEVLRAELRRRPISPDEFDRLVDTPEVPAAPEVAEVAAPEEPQAIDIMADFECLDAIDGAQQATPESAPAPVNKKGFAFYTVAEFMDRTPPSWIIKGLLPRAELGVIYGDSGAGKTFAALDQAMSIARGVDWRGRKTVQGRVAYIVAEGQGGFMDRIRAYCRQHKVDMATLPLHILPAAPDFMDNDKESTAGVLALARELKKLGPLAALYVDTYARVMSGNENDAKDASAVVKNCSNLHRVCKGIIMLVHHSGKDSSKGARGSGVLRAAADVEYAVTKADARHTMTVTKMKDGEDGGKLHYKLATIEVGWDEDGETRTSCVVEHLADDVAADEDTPKKRGEVQALILERLSKYPDGIREADFLLDVKAHTKKTTAGVHDKNWKSKITAPLGKLIDLGDVKEVQGVISLPKSTCD